MSTPGTGGFPQNEPHFIVIGDVLISNSGVSVKLLSDNGVPNYVTTSALYPGSG